MKKTFITLTILLLSSFMLNSATFGLDRNPNLTLLSKKGYLNDESDLLAITKSDKSEESFNMQAEESETHFAKQGVFYVNISPALLPGVALGYGWLNHKDTNKRYFETIYFLRSHLMGVLPVAGMGILINTFNNPERKGFYSFTKGGIDYVYKFSDALSALNPGGSTSYKVHKIFFPNIALGGGYSFKIGKSSFLRISLDIGIKYLLTNLNISYVF